MFVPGLGYILGGLELPNLTVNFAVFLFLFVEHHM